jgi:hypothetical protein
MVVFVLSVFTGTVQRYLNKLHFIVRNAWLLFLSLVRESMPRFLPITATTCSKYDFKVLTGLNCSFHKFTLECEHTAISEKSISLLLD